MTELGVAIRMRGPLPRLGQRLGTEVHAPEHRADRIGTDLMPKSLQFAREIGGALGSPTQERFRVTSSTRLYQIFQVFLQVWIRLGQALSSGPRLAHAPRRDDLPRITQLSYSSLNTS